MKRVVSIQDFSCVGKCSLTVALPVISAMGVECAAIPTAVLSAHTAFPGFTCADLSGQLAPIAAHWKKLGLRFDTIYTGYLASRQQAELVCRFLDEFGGANTLIFVDPAMADNGALYPSVSPDFPAQMAKLCARADVIVPNLTEACLLTGTEFRTAYDEAYLRTLLNRLLKLGAKRAVITGIRFEEDEIGVVAADGSGAVFSCAARQRGGAFCGTGDLFASACVGAMTAGRTLEQALAIAVDYTAECIRLTMENPEANWYGLEFERATAYLLRRMEQ